MNDGPSAIRVSENVAVFFNIDRIVSMRADIENACLHIHFTHPIYDENGNPCYSMRLCPLEDPIAAGVTLMGMGYGAIESLKEGVSDE